MSNISRDGEGVVFESSARFSGCDHIGAIPASISVHITNDISQRLYDMSKLLKPFEQFRIEANDHVKVICKDGDGAEIDPEAYTDLNLQYLIVNMPSGPNYAQIIYSMADDEGNEIFIEGIVDDCEFLNNRMDIELDHLQQIVVDNYQNGEFAHLKTKREVDECGDGLLRYLVTEISVNEDCDSSDEVIRRLNASIDDIEWLKDAFMAPAPKAMKF